MLRIELGYSVRIVHVFNHWAISMACIRILNVYAFLLSTLQVIFSLSVPSYSPLLIITSVLL